MANEQNLVDLATRPLRERQEIARKGQKAATEAKKRKKSMAEMANMMLNMRITDTAKTSIKRSGINTDDIDPDDMTAVSYMIAGQIKAAAQGNTKAMEYLSQLSDRAEKKEDAPKYTIPITDITSDFVEVYRKIHAAFDGEENVREIISKGGRGSIKSNFWAAVAEETIYNGRRLVKRKTKEEIEDFLVEFYKERKEPQTIEKTYNEWIDKKLKFEEISNQTRDRYNVDLQKYFSSCKDMEIRYVTTDFLDNFIIDNIKRNNMKPKAWSNLRTLIRGIFLFAKKRGYCQTNITEYLQELEISRKLLNHEQKSNENSVFSKEEIKILIDSLKTSKNIKDLAILMAIYTGMRVGEIVALKWEDIGENYIHVCRTQINYKENKKNVHEIRNFPKTEAGIRDVVIVPELREVIKRIRAINPFTEYVFDRNGEPIHKHLVCSRLYTLCERYGFPKKGMHAIRKYYATLLINAGVEESIVTSQMGHTNIETTLKYYYKNNHSIEYATTKISNAMIV